jgi:hypothetical protein
MRAGSDSPQHGVDSSLCSRIERVDCIDLPISMLCSVFSVPILILCQVSLAVFVIILSHNGIQMRCECRIKTTSATARPPPRSTRLAPPVHDDGRLIMRSSTRFATTTPIQSTRPGQGSCAVTSTRHQTLNPEVHVASKFRYCDVSWLSNAQRHNHFERACRVASSSSVGVLRLLIQRELPTTVRVRAGRRRAARRACDQHCSCTPAGAICGG